MGQTTKKAAGNQPAAEWLLSALELALLLTRHKVL